jgi:two-component system sensor histidine kinase AlgZ
VDWQLGPLPEDTPVPGLVIQPLLENAIYHGIEPMPQPGRIRVSGESVDGMVRISVSNPLPPSASAPRHGNRIALDNIRERLELAFGVRGVLSVIDSVPGMFTVTIEFPAGAQVLPA